MSASVIFDRDLHAACMTAGGSRRGVVGAGAGAQLLVVVRAQQWSEMAGRPARARKQVAQYQPGTAEHGPAGRGLRKGTEERPPPETGVCDLCGADRDAGDLCCSARRMPTRFDMDGNQRSGPTVLVASKGDITKFGVGSGWPVRRVGIVNAANCGGLGGGGVDGAITRAGGRVLAQDRKALPVIRPPSVRIKTGDCVVTRTTAQRVYGKLYGLTVVHAVRASLARVWLPLLQAAC